MQAPTATAKRGAVAETKSAASMACVDTDKRRPPRSETIVSTQTRASPLAPQVQRDVVDFCMNLLLLDDILTSKEKFHDFCIDIYLLECYVTLISKLSDTYWHAGMTRHQIKHAALCCCFVTACVDKVLKNLGENGRAALMRGMFAEKCAIPEGVKMVWAYLDWKHATTSSSRRRRNKKGSKSVWDAVFTPESVCKDPILRCAVEIGMEAAKIDTEAAFTDFDPFADPFAPYIY